MAVARVYLSGHSALPLSVLGSEGKPELTSQTTHLVHRVLLLLLYLPFQKNLQLLLRLLPVNGSRGEM